MIVLVGGKQLDENNEQKARNDAKKFKLFNMQCEDLLAFS